MRNRHRRVAEELESLLEGSASTDEVSGEARRLATLATTVAEERPGPVATLTDDRRLAMRDRLLDDIVALDAPATPAAVANAGRATRRARAAVASGIASALIAGTGVTVAAQEALPGDVLYGLKKGTESVRMNLASDATQAARLELRFAEERLEEVTTGLRRVPSASLVDSLAEMDRRSLAGAQQLILDAERSGEGELLAEVDAFIERQSTGIVDIFPRLPIEVRPHAEDSLATLREIRSELLVPAIEACDCIDLMPASYTDSDFVGRASSDSLPPAPPEQETESSSASSSADDDEATSEPDRSNLREPIENVTRDRNTSDGDGVGSRLLEPLGETGEKVGGAVDDTVDRTTDSVGEVVEEGGDLVEDTTDAVEDTLDETTESVGDLLGSTTDTADRLLGR